MSEETGETEERCINCNREAKVYRIIREEVAWGGAESKKGVVKLIVYDAAGPVCRKCMLEVLDYLRRQVELGKALVPRSGRTKRFKVIKGGP